MKEFILDVTITLRGPVISGASAAGSFGIDIPFSRTGDNKLYFPKSHIKGRLREALCQIVPYINMNNGDIEALFGKESPDRSDDSPSRGKLIFTDFINDNDSSSNTHTRIRMDSARGATAEGAYVIIDKPFAAGEEIDFNGTISFICENDPGADSIKNLIEKGLRWIPALGGQKSAGFGHIKSIRVDYKTKTDISLPSITNKPPCEQIDNSGYLIKLILSPSSPFCLSRHKNSDNLFESEDFISGGAIKGSLASTLNYILNRPLGEPVGVLPEPWREIGQHFSKIRICHGFPAINSGFDRPTLYPLSVVRAPESKNGEVKSTYDVLLCNGPGLINKHAPLFSIDWKDKDFEAVADTLENVDSLHKVVPPSFPARTLDVRTAINSEIRSAETGKLFAMESIRPDGILWHSLIDISRVLEKDRHAVYLQIESLMKFGLRFFSKTKTEVSCTTEKTGWKYFSELAVPTDKTSSLHDGTKQLWAVTLQTPAIMIPSEPALNRSLINKNILFAAYDDFWKSVSGGRLSLINFFAHQKMVGGGYLHRRFGSARPYYPLLLTLERSVFLLYSGNSKDEINRLFESWCNTGLPVPEWVKKYFDHDTDLWKFCPFIPENGFGEIVVNLKCHSGLFPGNSYEEVRDGLL